MKKSNRRLTELGRLIEHRRIEMGLTSRKLAQMAGIPDWKLSQVKRQKWTGKETLKKLADVLEVDVAYFFGDWGKQPNLPRTMALSQLQAKDHA